jgi:plastocyanin
MKSRFGAVIVVASSLILAAAMLSCGSKQGTSSEGQTSGASASGKAVDAATAGSIMGTIRLDGMPPRMKVINMAAEPNCAKLHSTPVLTQDVVPGDNGTLQNVVVYLQGDFSQYTFAAPQSPVTIDQKGCTYEPHVLALQTGQPLDVVNSDPVTHNIHPVPKDNREWNQSQPPGSSPIMQSFAREEVAIPVKCNIHPWMKAYIAVLSNPYFQVTGKDGSFDLKDVPPGSYKLIAWHELYGTQEQDVTIGPKESKTVTLTFNTKAVND